MSPIITQFKHVQVDRDRDDGTLTRYSKEMLNEMKRDAVDMDLLFCWLLLLISNKAREEGRSPQLNYGRTARCRRCSPI